MSWRRGTSLAADFDWSFTATDSVQMQKVEKMVQSRAESQDHGRREDAASVATPALGKILVVSPHLDDAVLGCGDLLALHPGACVLTVFAGAPQNAALTDWDRLAGFRRSGEAVSTRKDEDTFALFLLDAYPVWLDFLDAQYRNGACPAVQAVADALETAIAQQAPDHVLFPLGLFHDDHGLTSDAMLRVCRTLPDVQQWIVYADALYRELSGEVERRLEQLRVDGWLLTPLPPASPQGEKRRAVECYESQLRALATPGHVGAERALGSEAYWTLTWVS